MQYIDYHVCGGIIIVEARKAPKNLPFHYCGFIGLYFYACSWSIVGIILLSNRNTIGNWNRMTKFREIAIKNQWEKQEMPARSSGTNWPLILGNCFFRTWIIRRRKTNVNCENGKVEVIFQKSNEWMSFFSMKRTTTSTTMTYWQQCERSRNWQALNGNVCTFRHNSTLSTDQKCQIADLTANCIGRIRLNPARWRCIVCFIAAVTLPICTRSISREITNKKKEESNCQCKLFQSISIHKSERRKKRVHHDTKKNNKYLKKKKQYTLAIKLRLGSKFSNGVCLNRYDCCIAINRVFFAIAQNEIQHLKAFRFIFRRLPWWQVMFTNA